MKAKSHGELKRFFKALHAKINVKMSDVFYVSASSSAHCPEKFFKKCIGH